MAIFLAPKQQTDCVYAYEVVQCSFGVCNKIPSLTKYTANLSDNWSLYCTFYQLEMNICNNTSYN